MKVVSVMHIGVGANACLSWCSCLFTNPYCKPEFGRNEQLVGLLQGVEPIAALNIAFYIRPYYQTNRY